MDITHHGQKNHVLIISKVKGRVQVCKAKYEINNKRVFVNKQCVYLGCQGSQKAKKMVKQELFLSYACAKEKAQRVREIWRAVKDQLETEDVVISNKTELRNTFKREVT